MGKFALYNVPLRGLTDGTHKYDYKLTNQFFELISDADSDLRKGSVNVDLTVIRKGNLFEMDFVLNGEAYIPCDRCLDDMTVEIDTKNRLIVKFGKEYSEESEEIVIIPEDDGEINIAWFLYEFISLNIPIKHVHPPGKCNKVMSSKLNKHRAVSTSDDDNDSDDMDMDIDDEGIVEDDTQTNADSRWDALKDLNLDD